MRNADRFENVLIVLFTLIILTFLLFITGVFHFKAPAGPPVKYGFINRLGKLQTDIVYDSVGDFHGGFATVKKGGQVFVIDTAGRKTTLKPFYFKAVSFDIHHHISSTTTTEFQALNRPYLALGNEKDGKTLFRILRQMRGSKSSEGKHDFDFVYAFIDRHDPRFKPVVFEEAYPFCDSMALVRGAYGVRQGRPFSARSWGYIGPDGQFVVRPMYYDAHSYSEGLAAVAILMIPH